MGLDVQPTRIRPMPDSEPLSLIDEHSRSSTHAEVSKSWWVRNIPFCLTFETDVLYAMRLGFLSACCMVAIASFLISYKGSSFDHLNGIFDNSLAPLCFSLIVSIPIVVDVLIGAVFFPTNNVDIRRLIIIVLIFPNLLIYCRVIPKFCLGLVLFYQFVSLYVISALHFHLMVSAEKIVSIFVFREILLASSFASFFGFLYALADHEVIAFAEVWKALLTMCVVILQGIVWYKARLLSRNKKRLKQIMEQIDRSKETFVGIVLILSLMFVVLIVHLACYQQQWIFFPREDMCYIAFEWFFVAVFVGKTSLHFYHHQNNQNVTQNKLEHNRRLTSSVSHEIRTPLNTAFMALDLLISNLHDSHFESLSVSQRKTALLDIAESVKEGCDISLSILNQLLTFEKLSAGMMQLEPRLISSLRLFDTNFRLFHMQAQQKGLELSVEMLEHDQAFFADALLHVDENKINQVLRNLLSNAIKFTPRRGCVRVQLGWKESSSSTAAGAAALVYGTTATRREGEREDGAAVMTQTKARAAEEKCGGGWCCWARSESHGSGLQRGRSVDGESSSVSSTGSSLFTLSSLRHRASQRPSFQANGVGVVHQSVPEASPHGTLVISVIDSGPGVSKTDQLKLFQEYVQINPGELQKGQGTGLGLSICKSIVELHNGKIGMHSDGKNRGSTFFVVLPCYQRFDKPPSRSDSGSEALRHWLPFPVSSLSSSTVIVAPGATGGAGAAPSVPPMGDQGADIEMAAAAPGADLRRQFLSDSSVKKKPQPFLLPSPAPAPAPPVMRSHSSVVQSYTSFSPAREDEANGGAAAVPRSRSLEFVESATERVYASQPSLSPAAALRILVVDDSAANRKLLCRLLEREGHNVSQAEDGKAAVQAVQKSLQIPPHAPHDRERDKEGEFDLVFIDFLMPQLNGPDAVQIMRKIGYTGTILGITGLMDEESQLFIERGANGVLSKPVTTQMLSKALLSVPTAAAPWSVANTPRGPLD